MIGVKESNAAELKGKADGPVSNAGQTEGGQPAQRDIPCPQLAQAGRGNQYQACREKEGETAGDQVPEMGIVHRRVFPPAANRKGGGAQVAARRINPCVKRFRIFLRPDGEKMAQTKGDHSRK